MSDRDTALAKALSHPVRLQSLKILDERVASPSEIAEELELPVSNVAYHVRALLQLGCIEEVATRPVRGALEHLYRAIRRPALAGDEWEDIPASARAQIATAVFAETLQDARAALDAGVFDADADRHISRTELVLDDEGWRTLNERLEALRAEALELQAAAARRLSNDADGARRSTLALLHFEQAGEEAASAA